jgi:TP901 family phage tail tape measure protein
MAEQIKKSDIINDDVLPSLKKGLQENLSVLEKMDIELKSVAKSFVTLTKAEKKRLEGITKLNQQQLQAERLVKEKIKNDTERIKQQQQLVKLEALEQKQKVAIRKENERLLRLKERLEKNLTDETNAYKRLVKQTRDYKNESKRLGAELLNLESAGKRNTKQYRDLSRTYKQVTASAKAGDVQLKKLDATVGDNFRNVGNYQKAIGGLRNALSSLGLAFGIREVVRNVGGTIVDFDSSMQNLKAIVGSNVESLERLARELGGSTIFSAQEASEAMRLLAMAGLNTNQILTATPQVLSLASAGNIDLARSADIATNVMSGFGLEASELNRVVDVIAKTATSTNTTVETLGESFKEIAPTANNLKIPIEEIASAVGLLGNSGIKGTDATTTLNSALNRLSKPTKEMKSKMKELNLSFFDANGQFVGITKTIDRLEDSFVDLTDEQRANAISTIFGARANKQMTSLILGQTTALKDGKEEVLQGSEALKFLTKEYENASGSAKEMAETQEDSVAGSLKLLNSAYKEFILRQSDASGAVDKLKTAIGFLAKNLGTILGVLGRLTRAFIVYKSVTLSLKLGRQIKNFAMLAVNIGKTATASKDAGSGIKSVGRSIKNINWASIIAVVVELAISFYDVASGARQARIDAENLENYQNTASKQQSERSQKRQEDLRDEIELIDQRLRREEISAEEALKLKELEANKTQKLVQSDIDVVQEKINKNSEYLEILEKVGKASTNFQVGSFQIQQALGGSETEALIKFNKALNSVGVSVDDVSNVFGNFNTDNFNEFIGELNAKIGAGETKLEGYKEELKSTSKEVGELQTQTVELNKTQEDNTSKINAQVKSYEDINKELKERKKLEADINDALSGATEEDLRAEELQQELNFAEKKSKQIELFNIKNAETQEEFDKLELERQKELLEEKIDLLEVYGQDSTDLQIELAKLNQDLNEKLVNQDKNFFEELNQTQQQITDGLKENIDRRIELRKREADEAQNLQNFYQELASNGNINAQQSIAKQIELQREALKEQERLERQKAKLELISSGLNTFSTELENGKTPQEAFATTVLTSQALVQFLGNLNAFEKGTDNAPKGLAWTQEKGAEVIADKKGNIKSLGSDGGASLTMLEAGDKVYNAQKSKAIIENLRSSKDGDLIRRAKETSGNSYDLMRLESLMKEQTQALKNKKEIEIHWDSVQRGLVEKVKRGGDITTTIYKTR